MRWKKEYNNGIPLIDTQHKQLFRFSEELQTAISSGLKLATLKELLGGCPRMPFLLNSSLF